MTERECLAVARDRIGRGWTQGKYALTSTGMATLANAPDATCWCLLGAIQEPGGFANLDALKRLTALAGNHPAAWNDHPGRTQAEALALVERALAEVP